MPSPYSFSITTSKFDAFVDALGGDVSEAQEKIVRGMGLKFIDMVCNSNVEGTTVPVDTGRARAGWAAFADNQGVPLSPAGSDPKAQARGRREGSFTFREQGRGSHYLGIRNAVPYIVPLEYGHSQKAPGGFVRLTLERMRTGVAKDALAELRDSIGRSNAQARATGLKWKKAA